MHVLEQPELAVGALGMRGRLKWSVQLLDRHLAVVVGVDGGAGCEKRTHKLGFCLHSTCRPIKKQKKLPHEPVSTASDGLQELILFRHLPKKGIRLKLDKISRT